MTTTLAETSAPRRTQVKNYGNKTVTIRDACMYLQCDRCHSIAERPDIECWEWGSCGLARGRVIEYISIDGEELGNEIDLCPDCIKEVIEYARTRIAQRISVES